MSPTKIGQKLKSEKTNTDNEN